MAISRRIEGGLKLKKEIELETEGQEYEELLTTLRELCKNEQGDFDEEMFLEKKALLDKDFGKSEEKNKS